MASEAEPEVGRIVDGKYRLTRLVGRGGMGSVWEGVHTTLGTRFALKYIDAAFAGRKDVEARFANEALAAARLESKHIVKVYDHGVDEHGCPYIVMEFLSGEALDARLARDGTLSLEQTADLVFQVAKALSRAHAAGIVHRDLKPENVFLSWDEEDQRTVVKVVDFGIAKFTDGTFADSATRTGAVLGTPHFMSPEQARGLKTVDFAADLWSLGVIAYRALTGRPPFEGEAVGDLLVKICTVPHAPPSRFMPVPDGLDEWMAKSLAKEPKDRFPSVVAQAEALAALVEGAHFVVGSATNEAPGSLGAGAFGDRALDTPGGLRAPDTQAGLERPRSGMAPSRRLLWGIPAAAVAAALAFLAFGRPEHRIETSLVSEPSGSLPLESTAAVPAPGPAAETSLADPPSQPEPAASTPPVVPVADRHQDAGATEPAVRLGRPADSSSGRARTLRPAPQPRSGARSPEPSRPAPRQPRDELGY